MSAPDGGASTAEAVDLVVIDLSGTNLNRRLLRWFASAITKRAARRRPGKVALLVFAPYGDASTVAVPDNVELVHASSIDPSAAAAVDEWAYASANRLVFGPGRHLFTEYRGVDFGQLNLSTVQRYFRDYGILAAALRAFGERRHIGRCVIVSGHADTALATAREARALADSVETWMPPMLLRDSVSLAARLLRREPSRTHGDLPDVVKGLQPRVLMVSESAPMRRMFAVVEEHLNALGVGPTLRLEYGTDAGAKESLDGANLVVTRAMATPDACPADARAQIDAHVRDLPRLCAEGDGAATPSIPGHVASMPVEQFLHRLAVESYPEQAAHLVEAQSLLEQLRPEIVVAGNDRWWVGQTFVRAAQRMGIPTVALQDGIEITHPHWFWLAADVLGSSGDIYPSYLTSHGVDASRLHVVGQPRYDSFTRAARRSDVAQQAAARRQLGVPETTFCVLFAAQPEQAPPYAAEIVESVLRVPGVHLVVRPHPSTPPEPYAQLVARQGSDRVTLQTEGDTVLALTACDAVVLQHSTVAVEAAILGRLVITANFSGLPDVAPFVDLGIALRVISGADLTATISRLVGMGPADRSALLADAHRALERLIGPQDGGAGLRAAKLIASCLDNRSFTADRTP